MCTSSAFRVGLPPGHARRTSVSRPTTAPNRSTSAAASARSTGDKRHPAPTMPEQPVGVDGGCGDGLAGTGRERRDARTKVVLGGRQADPVLERVDRRWGRETLAHEQQPGRTRRPKALQPRLLLGPADQHDVGAGLRVRHVETVRSTCFGLVTAK